MNPARLLLLGIVVALPGCDNVTWGGIDVELQTSEERLAAEGLPVTPDPDVAQPAETAPPVEIGPMLLIGRPQAGQAELSLIGHLVDGQLTATSGDPATRAVLDDRLSRGKRFTLFSEGTHVGTFTATSRRAPSGYCGPRPGVIGVVELIPTAIQVGQFIAIEVDGIPLPDGGFQSPQHNYDQRVASLAMMRDAVPVLGATWPESILDIRRDVQIFQEPGREAPTVAATFVYEDGLAVGAAPDQAYSVFLLGDNPGTGYQPSFLSYRRVGDRGKGAPRFFDHLDWDGDGTSEVVLEVVGESDTWVSALDRNQDGWTEVFHDACGTPSPNVLGTR